MSDLKPWRRDDVPPEIGRLLHAARNDSPRRGAVDRALLMLSSAATVGTATSGVLGAVTKVGTGSLGWVTKWGAATLLGIGLGTTAAVTAQHYASDTTPEATPTPLRSTAQSSAARAPSPSVAGKVIASSSEPSPAVATPQPAAGAPATPTESVQPVIKQAVQARSDERTAIAAIVASAASGNQRETPPTVAPAPQLQKRQEDLQLAEEMRYLDQARGALQQSRPHDALKWLAGYQRNCPAQRMLPEAMLLRLRAEVNSGNRAAALATARQISLQFPESPHAARARELIAAEHFE